MSSHNARHLQDAILGGQDGLVNVLGLSLGVVGATADPSLVVVSGMAAMFAESISMGAVAYTSANAAIACEKKRALEAEFEKKDIDKILTMLSHLPAKKFALVRSKLLSHEEGTSAPVSTAIKVWLSTMCGSFIPLFPYFLLPVWDAALASILLSGFVLFFTGALKAKWTIGDWKESGFEMLAVGTLAAIAGYIIGVLLRAPV
ncbi:VIT1/CCC1 transporter family protein [Candidatus Micrarchaeota archaeon]|nr:VIT1/CCC1 transporter family protein [Candidatus Micrarchaeota archaeon]